MTGGQSKCESYQKNLAYENRPSKMTLFWLQGILYKVDFFLGGPKLSASIAQ